jgi:hypothetical protein
MLGSFPFSSQSLALTPPLLDSKDKPLPKGHKQSQQPSRNSVQMNLTAYTADHTIDYPPTLIESLSELSPNEYQALIEHRFPSDCFLDGGDHASLASMDKKTLPLAEPWPEFNSTLAKEAIPSMLCSIVGLLLAGALLDVMQVRLIAEFFIFLFHFISSIKSTTALEDI